MAKMAQEQSGGKEPGEIVKTENKAKETKLAKVQPQVSILLKLIVLKSTLSRV